MKVSAKINQTANMRVNAYMFPLMYIVFALLFELVQFSWLGFGALPKYFLLDLSCIIVLASVIWVMPNNAAKNSVMYSLLGLQFVVNIVNVTLYRVFGDILSFDMLKLGAEGVAAFSFQFLDFVNILVNIILLVVAILMGRFITKNILAVRRVRRYSKVAFIMVIFFLMQTFGCSFYLVGISTLTDTNKSNPMYIVESDAYLYDTMYLKLESYKKFGTFGFYFKSVGNLIFNPNALEDEELDKAIAKVQAGEGKYYTSSMSDKLEGDNIVMILMESFDWYAISPVYTPTLYALSTGTYKGPDGNQANSGYAFHNFYGRNKTNISEGIAFLGNMPRQQMLVSYQNDEGLCAPYSLPNLLRQEAKDTDTTYKSNYLHTYISTFYNRHITYDKLGFDDMYCVDNVYNPNPIDFFNDWISDEDFFKDTIDYLLPTNVDRFFTQFTSMSTHGSYRHDNSNYKKHKSFIESNFDDYKEYITQQTTFKIPSDSQMVDVLQHYLAGAVDFDRAISYLLEQMQARNLLDTTSIVMYADHNSYYDDLSVHMKGLSKNEFSEVEAYRIPFIIYSSKLGAGVDNTFCSTYDIYPTVCDLYGLPVNSAITQGNSIFSDEIENSIFVSFLSGIFTDEMYTTNIVDITKITDKDLSPEQVERFQQKAIDFYNRQDLIEKVWENNIFKKMKASA